MGLSEEGAALMREQWLHRAERLAVRFLHHFWSQQELIASDYVRLITLNDLEKLRYTGSYIYYDMAI